jgi:putative peptidoglycan lipid II flippase
VSAFPTLTVREGREFDETAAASTRAVLLLSFLGTAVLVAISVPAAHFLASYPSQVPQLAGGFALFALGLAGYGLVACLSRVLLAQGQTSVAAFCVVGGWLLVILADVVLVTLAPASWVVPVLALGNAIGLSVSGLALAAAVWRTRGRPALTGTLRTGLSGLAAAAAGAGAGAGLVALLPAAGSVQEGLIAVLAAACALGAFGLVAYLLDSGDLRDAMARARRAIPR